jgi:hypothetical protein
VEDLPQPAPHRLVWAFAAAPAAAALALGLVMAVVTRSLAAGLGVGAFGLLLFGYPATLLLGLPAYLALRRRMRLTPLRCALAGAVIGGAPLLLIFAANLAASGFSTRDLDDIVIPALGATAAGALGGVVFWAFAAWTPRRPAATGSE